MATFTNAKLANTALTTTLTTTLYTVPAATTVIVRSITVTNSNTTTTRNVTLDLDATTLLAAYALAPKETLLLEVEQVLDAADLIRGGQDTGTDVYVLISGVKIT